MLSLPLRTLNSWNPFKHTVWLDMEPSTPITKKEIREAIRKGLLWDQPVENWDPGSWVTIRERHVRRIAHLVVAGWEDPIDFEACPGSSSWPIYDGNHRLAAAFYRKDPVIRVEVGGFLNLAAELLGIDPEVIKEDWDLT